MQSQVIVFIITGTCGTPRAAGKTGPNWNSGKNSFRVITVQVNRHEYVKQLDNELKTRIA